jgi:hypothetical protein
MSNEGRIASARWLRIPAILVIVAALVFSASASALAISYGEPDGDDHPFVGSIVVDHPVWGLIQWCSGTLIAENVFLTASHCTVNIDSFLAANPGSQLFVTFDPTISERGTFYTGAWYTNPNYTGFQGKPGHSDPGDIAVIVLDQAPGIAPARLPTAGLLDQLKDSKALNGSRYTTVGYGDVRETIRTGFSGIQDNMDRNRAEQTFRGLMPAWLHVSMNPNHGNGGTCYGDSGGPHFIHLNGAETDIVVAITVTGDSQCKSSDVMYRMDTEAARAFLAGFVDLP